MRKKSIIARIISRLAWQSAKREGREAINATHNDRKHRNIMPTKNELIDAVTAYAEAHYNTGGWDVVVEAYTEEEIWERISHCKTATAAVSIMRKIAKAHKEHGEEIRSEAF